MSEAHPDWSTDSNSAVHISLVTSGVGGTKALHTFNPKFTYPIFGDAERIFGYQGLKINLRYNACDMRPGLQIVYTRRFKAEGETVPTDLKAIFEEFLPKTAFEKSSVFEAAVGDAAYASWTPPGELWQSLEAKGKIYEVWKGSLADLAVKQLVRRIQILVPFFIEGGTLIDLEEPDSLLERWTVFFLYEKSTNPAPGVSGYTFMGYSTVYRFYFHQTLTPPSSPPTEQTISGNTYKQRINRPADLEFDLTDSTTSEYSFLRHTCRSRISQFLILPPFHGGGNGSRFYNSIFDYYFKEPETIEITVEDPNEAFDDLRDLNDLARLRKVPAFADLKINGKVVVRTKGPVPKDIVDAKTLQKIRKDIKIAPRQFARLVEMHLLSQIPTSIRQSLLPQQPTKIPDRQAREHEYHLWQILTKQRLYRHNRDSLMQLDRTERIEKLEDALGNVEADYARLLRAFDERNGKDGASNGASSNGKRASPMIEEDEPSAKKIRFA